MNKIYKIIWNSLRNCLIVVNELTSSQRGTDRDQKTRGKKCFQWVTFAGLLGFCLGAQATMINGYVDAQGKLHTVGGTEKVYEGVYGFGGTEGFSNADAPTSSIAGAYQYSGYDSISHNHVLFGENASKNGEISVGWGDFAPMGKSIWLVKLHDNKGLFYGFQYEHYGFNYLEINRDEEGNVTAEYKILYSSSEFTKKMYDSLKDKELKEIATELKDTDFKLAYVRTGLGGTIGKFNETNKLINVSAGDISENSNEAITGAQIYTIQQAVNSNTSSIELKANADASEPKISGIAAR